MCLFRFGDARSMIIQALQITSGRKGEGGTGEMGKRKKMIFILSSYLPFTSALPDSAWNW